MELEKRIRKSKDFSEKKLGIKHYLNTKLKGSAKEKKLEKELNLPSKYPVYVQLTFNSETVRFKSETNIFHTDTNISNYSEDLLEKIKYEQEKISYCFQFLLTESYSGKSLSDRLKEYLYVFTTELDILIRDRLYLIIWQEIVELKNNNSDIKIDLKNFKDKCKDLSETYSGIGILQKIFNNNPVSILELYCEYDPSLLIIKEAYPSKIWYFDAYYSNFKVKASSDVPLFSDRSPTYTLYEFHNGVFEREFVRFYKLSTESQKIIIDMRKVLILSK